MWPHFPVRTGAIWATIFRQFSVLILVRRNAQKKSFIEQHEISLEKLFSRERARMRCSQIRVLTLRRSIQG